MKKIKERVANSSLAFPVIEGENLDSSIGISDERSDQLRNILFDVLNRKYINNSMVLSALSELAETPAELAIMAFAYGRSVGN